MSRHRRERGTTDSLATFGRILSPPAPSCDPLLHEWFDEDITGHLRADFGDTYALDIEPHDGFYHCYIGGPPLGPDKPVFATFTALDARDVLALAVAIENTVRLENGEVLDAALCNGFTHRGKRIHNPFNDPEQDRWLFSRGRELQQPWKLYGRAYEDWRDVLVAEMKVFGRNADRYAGDA